MGTNTAATTARLYHQQVVHYLSKKITFEDNGTAVTVGVIPAGSTVIGGGVHVTTAFDDTGTDLLDVGTSGNDDAFATDLTLAAVGFIALDELAATTNTGLSSDTTITATYTGQNSNAAAGVAYVIVTYVPNVGAE